MQRPSPPPTRHQAVIFDMDGLMLDTERVAIAAYRQAALACGWTVADAIWHDLIGRNQAGSRAVLIDRLGPDYPYEQVQALGTRLYTEMLAREGVQTKPGLQALLQWLADRSVPCAVATSSRFAMAEHKLTAAGVRPFFSFVVGGDQVANGKPAPDVFLAAAKGLSVAPRLCVALEDSENGLLAAQAAGMTTLLVPDLKRPAPAVRRLAHSEHESLSQAQAVIEQFFGAD